MRCLVFLSLLLFSDFLLADCIERYLKGRSDTEYTNMSMCYHFAPRAQVVGRPDRRMLVFQIYPADNRQTRFDSHVRQLVNTNDQGRCVVVLRERFNRNKDYLFAESDCDNYPYQKLTFYLSNDDGRNAPFLYFFSLDTSRATSDINVSFEVAGEEIWNNIRYYTKPAPIMDSCAIEVYGNTGGMIFSDESDRGDKTLDVRMHAQGRRRLKLVSNSNSYTLNNNFEGYSVQRYSDSNRLISDSVLKINASHPLRLRGSYYLRLAPKYNYKKSDLPPGDYITTLEIVCE
ncbi:hypothetical protein F0225_13720 [Vibrio pectenicida]|uniref:Spore coat protein U domain-containing protein n=1 Tax=Vibrio pectenicida TaxID=62763 RepID=A0A7Y4A0P2_9VIBR|nr:hypothetical protein [Vibrio pectenicida]NOH72388.1 hypothetical protein [Vibrio pectenicida]